jgi:sugar lactone lactonase YvrE
MKNTFYSNITTSSIQGAFMGRRLWAIIGFSLLVFLAACSSAPAAVPAVGTLQVNISGLPSGVNASVKVTGTGFTQDLTASTPLSNRAVGSYTVTAENVTSGGQTFIGTVTGSPATVTANTTSTVTVTYAVSPASLGTLQVNLVVPGGGNGNVSISGPNGFSRTITATTTLNDLVPGAYTLTAINVPGVGTSADLILVGTVSGTSTVEANKTATATVTYAATTGTLKITVNGLPAGVNADIVVVGAGASSQQTVTATTTLTGLAPNNYFVTVRNVRASGAIVDTVFVSSNDDELSIGAGQVQTKVVTYTERGGTASLWAPVFGSVSRLSASQLGGSGGAITPAGAITQAGSNEAVVFDANGNMYVSNETADSISRYTPTQLAAGGAQTPVTLTSSGLNNPIGMAFDSSGNLWVANPTVLGSAGNDRLVSFTPAQLTAGGSQTPDKTLTSGSFFDPVGLAFDTAGNLWVSNANSVSASLIRFTPAQLTAAGSQSPNRILSSTSFARPAQIAFDANGNLWVTNQLGNDIQGHVNSFTPAQLDAGSSQFPTVRLSGSALTLSTGLAFDKGGNLWVFRQGANLVQIAAANLAASGSPTAAKVISGIGGPVSGYLAFSPTPPNLPIQNK